MADTYVDTNAGSGGAKFKVDSDGTGDWPYAKLAFGASGTQTPVSSGNPLPTTISGVALDTTITAMSGKLPAALGQAAMAASMSVVIASNQSAVAVSAASLPLPTGAATAAKQPALGTAGSASADVISVQGIASGTAMAVSAASLPLPTGASTAAKQPALGTAGTASTDVLSVQGIASGTNLNVAVAAALPAGTNAIGKLSANSGVIIGDVNITTVPADPFGANADAASATGSISAKLRFIAGTGIPITGTVTVGSHAVTNAGTFAVQADGSVASGASDSGNPVKIAGKYNSSPITLTNGQRGDAQLDANGYLKVNVAAGGASGGTSSTFGSAYPATGTAIGAKDSSGTNMAALNLDASGYLKVNVAAGGGSGGTALADKAAFTEGTTNFTPIGGVYNETISANPTEDQAAALRMTAYRAVHVNLRDASGNELSAGAQYAEDSVHVSGDSVTVAGVVRKDTATQLAGTDGDYSVLINDASGRLHVNVGAVPADPFGANADSASATGSISAKLRFIAGTGIPVTGTVTVGGTVASAATDSGNPVKVGGKYNSSPITLTDGQRGDAQLDANGYLKVNVAAGGASGGTSSSFGSAIPATGTAAGYSDGTNMQSPRVFDLDSGGGTQYGLGVNLRQIASGGSVEAGIAANPLRTDPTGTTTQPVSLASVPSHAVTNAGTFAVQSTVAGSTIPTATTMQNAATANGNGTSLNVNGFAAAILNVVSSPAMSGGTTLNFEASVDDTTWVSINAHTVGSNTIGVTATADGDYRLATAGYKSVRARISAYSAGTVTIKGYASPLAPAQTTISLATGSATIGALTANQSVNVAQINGVTALMGNGVTGTGSQRVTIASDNTAFSVNAVQSGAWTVQPGNTQNTTAWLVTDIPATSGGWAISRTLAAATTNATNVKASAGQLGGWYIYNASAAIKYLKLYNSASAPTAGSGTPVMTVGIPATSAANVEFGKGIAFSSGIGFTLTGAVADNDTTALAANDLIMNLFYK